MNKNVRARVRRTQKKRNYVSHFTTLFCNHKAVIVVANQIADGVRVITVVPITQRKPLPDTAVIETRPALNTHIGVDDLSSWNVVAEVNEFVWPGVDLRPLQRTDLKEYAYSVIPQGFYNKNQSIIIGSRTCQTTACHVQQIKTHWTLIHRSG